MRTVILTVVTAGVLWSTGSAVWQEPLACRETLIARFDADADRQTLVVDRKTGRHAVWISGRKHQQRLVVDGTPGPVFDEVRFGRGGAVNTPHGRVEGGGFSPVMSADGSRVAYVARRGKWFNVVDGQEHGPYDGGAWRAPIVFSDDGRHVAWGTLRKGKYVQVIDGTEHGPYEADVEFLRIGLSSPIFSPDGRRTAFRARIREAKGTAQRLVVDGLPGLPRKWVGLPHFSADSRHLAYWGRDEGKDVLELFVDEKSVAAADTHSSDVLEVLDELLDRFDLPFAPDAAHLAYVTVKDGKFLPVVHGKEGPRAEWMGYLGFSEDFSRSAYAIAHEKTVSRIFGAMATLGNAQGSHRPMIDSRIVIDGTPHPEFPAPVGPPVFSRDNVRLAYPSRNAVVLDGIAGATYDDVAPASLAFSGDGRHLAYAASKGGLWRVIVDGSDGPAFAELGGMVPFGKRADLTFTPDGQHVIYRVSDGRPRVIVSNVGATKSYDDVLDVLVFERPDTAAFVAVRGNEILRVEIDLPVAATTRE